MTASDRSRGAAPRPGEIAIYVALLAIAVFAWVAAGDFAPEGARWPRALTLVLGLAVIMERTAVTVGARRRRPGAADSGPTSGETVEEASAPVAMAVTGAFFGYILLAYGVGFLLATPIFTVGFMLWRGFHRRPFLLAAVPIGLSVTIYIMFGRIISTPLTRGAWIEYSLPGPL